MTEWKKIFDAIYDPIAVLDKNFRILLVNKTMADKLRLSPDECIGKTCYRVVHGTEEPPEFCPHQRLLKDGFPHVADLNEERLGGYYKVSVSPLHDENGMVQGSVHVIHDINALNQTIEALKRSEDKQRLLLETSGEGIYGIDPEGRAMFINPAATRMLGYSAEEIVGKKSHQLIHHTKADGTHYHEDECRMLSALQKGEIVKVEDELLWRKDGTSFPVDYTSAPIRHNGALEGIVVNFTDISKRKKDEEERLAMAAKVEQALKYESLDVLAGGIAHNFNNILSVVLGNLDFLISSLPAEFEKEHKFAATAVKATQRAAKLSSMMLNFVGQGETNFQIIDLNEAVSHIKAVWCTTIANKVQVTSTCSDGNFLFEGDYALLNQVVVSLLSNANESSADRDVEIKLTVGKRFFSAEELKECPVVFARREGEYVFLVVEDNGDGMTEEIKERIFEPFYSTKFTGRGLGMAAVLGIIKRHNGSIFVRSSRAKGTAVTVLFPPYESAEDIDDGRMERPKADNLGKRVLFIDDEEMVVDVGRVMLKKMGFDVLTAQNGFEAMDIFTEQVNEISLVILDLTMPGMDGVEVMQSLRKLRHDIPVIISTAWPLLKFEDRLKEEGAYVYLQKPYFYSELREAVDRALFQKIGSKT